MATDEEYLDNLLKALNENEQQPRTMEEVMREVNVNSRGADSFSVTSEDLADMLDEIEKNDNVQHTIEEIEDASDSAGLESWKKEIFEEEPALEEEVPEEEPVLEAEVLEEEPVLEAEVPEEEPVLEAEVSEEEPVLEAEVPEEEPVLEVENPEEQMLDENFEIDDAEDWQSSLEELLAEADAQSREEQNQEEAVTLNPNSMDVTELIDNMENADSDLEEINGLLKKADNNEAVEDDMLALLESVKDDSDNSVYEDSNDPEDNSAEGELKEKPEKKKKKEKKERKEKKSGSKLSEKISELLTLLTQEDEELDLSIDENAEILKELDEEDRKKAKKEAKKKKKSEKKKKKGKGETSQEGEEALEEGEEEGKKKKKKKEKKKKEKPPKEKIVEKPVKVLSRRNLLVLVAACATLLASIFVLSTFLPEFADKKNARKAFYEGEYETTYKLFYDKKLNSSDAIIFNRVKTLLTIERKLDSYKNNLALNRKLEALDALIQGVVCYQELSGVDEYGVRNEVDAIYQKICSLLQENYGISPEDAIEINTYDNETYTRKLDSVIHGTEFVMPGEEITDEPLPLQDILPEEEEIISF